MRASRAQGSQGLPGSPHHVLALDLGTSSLRSAVFDAHLRTHRGSRARVHVIPAQPQVGASEFDAEALAHQVEWLLDQSLKDRTAPAIDAVGISCFWHSLLGLNDAGDPVTPVYLWGDLRSTPEAAALREELDERAIFARTGSPIHPTFWPARLRWLARNDPDAVRQTRSWVSFADFLSARWLGSLGSSLSMASATGLFDQNRQTWDGPMMDAAGLNASRLPPLVAHPRGAPSLKPDYARRWPQLRDSIWLPAIGDGACSNVGVHATTPDQWALTVGTSAAVRAITTNPPAEVPWGLWRYRVDPDRVIIGGATNNAGNLFAWLTRNLRLPRRSELEQALLSLTWGAHCLEVDPSLAGERAPDWPLDARGSIQGLSLQTDAIDIAQAVLEASATRLSAIARLLQTALGDPSAIVVTGGATRSAALARMLEHALGRNLTVSRVHESSLRGAAMLALEALKPRYHH